MIKSAEEFKANRLKAAMGGGGGPGEKKAGGGLKSAISKAQGKALAPAPGMVQGGSPFMTAAAALVKRRYFPAEVLQAVCATPDPKSVAAAASGKTPGGGGGGGGGSSSSSSSSSSAPRTALSSSSP